MNTKWNENAKWVFSPLGSGPKVGVNDVGIGVFKHLQYSGLAKEILQNVIDAKNTDLDNTIPAKAVFKLISIDKEEIPGREQLFDVIKRCHQYYNDGDDGEKMKKIYDDANTILNSSDKVKVLKISDYNTIGLLGAHEEKGTNWTGLVRETGATNKGNGKSGAFGVGKFAPFNFSALRTVVYSTKDKDGVTALQGKTILTSFRDSDEKIKQNVGLFGLMDQKSEDCLAIYKKDDIPQVYRREEIGTDLFVIGFRDEEDWMDQIAISVLEYFFYTIYIGKLVVDIEDDNKNISITKDSLPDYIHKYDAYCNERDIEFSAIKFWNVLTDESGRKKVYKEKFCNKGEVELHLIVDSELNERRIVEMRDAGMKIQEDSSFRIPASFLGVFIATGNNAKSDKPEDNISSFLRKCENQAHNVWSAEEYENNKEEAEKIIKKIHTWLLSKVKENIPKEKRKQVDAFGLNDFLPNQYIEGDDCQEEKAFIQYKPLQIEVKDARTKGARVVSDISSKINRKKLSNIIRSQESAATNEESYVFSASADEKNALEQIETKRIGERSKVPSDVEGEKHYGDGDNSQTQRGNSTEVNEKVVNKNGVLSNDQVENLNQKKEKVRVVKRNELDKNKVVRVGLKFIKTPYDEERGEYRISFVPAKNVKNASIKIRVGGDDEEKKRESSIISATHNNEKLQINGSFIVGIDLVKEQKYMLQLRLDNCERCVLEVSAYVGQ